MSWSAREYNERLIVTREQLDQMERAQREMYRSGIVRLNENRLMSRLAELTTVLGFAFIQSTPAGVFCK